MVAADQTRRTSERLAHLTSKNARGASAPSSPTEHYTGAAANGPASPEGAVGRPIQRGSKSVGFFAPGGRALGGDRGFGQMIDAHGALVLPQEDHMTRRMLSLPELRCKSATGDIFIVGLR